MTSKPKHVSVCICTYKRPQLLKRLLEELDRQDTGALFTWSIVVADNDCLRSAEPVVQEHAAVAAVPVKYCVEPCQGIARARNTATGNAGGDFIAFLDDDEFPTRGWLAALYRTCEEHGVDGALGPVQPLFDEHAPAWVVNGGFYDRPDYLTGLTLDWKKTRSGNVLFKRTLLREVQPAFRPEFRSGEDQDFFRRLIGAGHKFVWCSEAIVYEVVPPVRWKRMVILKRALLRGSMAALDPTLGPWGIVKSLVAILVYAAALPFALAMGQRWFMPLLAKFCDHLGKLLALVGVNLIQQQYVIG